MIYLFHIDTELKMKSYSSPTVLFCITSMLFFQEQLKTMESNLEKSVEEKLQAQEEGHQSAREKLKKR